MNDDNFETVWRQHFPTYAFKERDIALEEYKTAAKNLESEERVFLNASNIVVIAAAGLGSLAVGSLEKLTKQFETIIPAPLTLSILLLIIAGFSTISLLYFADRQRAIVFSARKVIVLRRMMGISYGSIQLVLPNWRIEGADEPFAVRLFPGWKTYVTYPYYANTGISSAVIFFLLAALYQQRIIPEFLGSTPEWGVIVLLTFFWALFLAIVYRKALLDIHERPLSIFAKNIAQLMQLKLVTNFEYIIYRATLDRYELMRLKINTNNLTKTLIFIEDRSFLKHHGFCFKASIRALLGLLYIKRRSGGSTITQQLVRTLFIHDQSKLFRRKTIEIILSLSFNRVFSKIEQIELYLASVRFERGVYGVIQAMNFYWGSSVEKTSMAESFLLIERVSNIYSRLLAEKIFQTVKSAMKEGLLTRNDIKELHKLYSDAIASEKI